MKLTFRNLGALMLMSLAFVACDDDDNNNDDNTSAEVKEFVDMDCTDYASWTYINLETGQTETHPDATEWVYTNGDTRAAQTPEEIGIDWHIAIHRYEIKTNGASVYDTQSTDINAINSLPTGGTWVADEVVPYGSSELEVITDMANMMSGGVGYSANPTLNDLLCGWTVRVETGSMPPTRYEPTMHVYVAKFNDGSWAKLQFTEAYRVASGTGTGSGIISWKYAFYPAE